jgi:VanZ family protein
MAFLSRRPLVAAVCWTALILILLGIPGRSLPSTTLLEYDKAIHAGLFLVLAVLWMRAARFSSVNTVVLVLMGGILFSVLSEWYQGILPVDRQPDVLDSVADLVGFLAGSLGWYIWIRFMPLSGTEK